MRLPCATLIFTHNSRGLPAFLPEWRVFFLPIFGREGKGIPYGDSSSFSGQRGSALSGSSIYSELDYKGLCRVKSLFEAVREWNSSSEGVACCGCSMVITRRRCHWIWMYMMLIKYRKQLFIHNYSLMLCALKKDFSPNCCNSLAENCSNSPTFPKTIMWPFHHE